MTDLCAKELTVDARKYYKLKHKLFEYRMKEEKYKWHDLVKNQSDLPDIEERVEIVLDASGRRMNSFGMINRANKWVVNGFITSLDVIAWRKIEPYEGR